MSILKQMKGLFVNGQKIADIEKDSVVEIRPKTLNVEAGNGYVNHGVHNGDVSFKGNIVNSPNSNVSNSFNGNQRIQNSSIGAVFGDNANVCVNQSKVIVDGFEYTLTDFTNDEVIKIEIYGDFNELKTVNGEAIVNGNVNSVKTQSGDIDVVGEVNGDIKTMSGDVKIKGNVHGKVSTMSGDIKHN